jgi:hypothetical protein
MVGVEERKKYIEEDTVDAGISSGSEMALIETRGAWFVALLGKYILNSSYLEVERRRCVVSTKA